MNTEHNLNEVMRMANTLHGTADERKNMPIVAGVLNYFPNAIAEIAKVSKIGNDQHNAGQPLHHARWKSKDHADCIVRHLLDSGEIDSDGLRHSAKVAWRALALLQEELEREYNLPLPRGARESVAAPELPVEVEALAEKLDASEAE